jgi:hypothetical protein
LFVFKALSASNDDDNILLSLADPTHSPKSAAKKHKSWLADLSVLPSSEDIEKLSRHVDKVIQHDKNPQ